MRHKIIKFIVINITVFIIVIIVSISGYYCILLKKTLICRENYETRQAYHSIIAI